MTNPTTLISTPFAAAGDKNTIQEVVPLDPNSPTWEVGFPAITSTPVSEGGLPPKRLDFNGVLNAVTENIVHQTKGLGYEFDAAYATKIGGYPLHAELVLANGDIVKSTVANNIINPNIDMTGWVKIGNLIIVNTVAELVAKNLKNGDVVKTLGYNNLSDNGGAFYIISNTATDYSILLSNGKHAVFNDDFDIRKFGIVSSATLDQTENLLRMRNYADTRIYEIDFLNFDLMSPKCVNYTSVRGSILKGLYFHYPHKWKNAKFYHDKTKQLVQGSCPLQFTPKQKGTGQVIELENIEFDTYIPDYLLISGEGDGRMHGFYAGWHPDYPVAWPTQARSSSGYSFKANGINSKSAAITSTLGLGLWFDSISFNNMKGDYIGYYTTFMANKVTAKNCEAVYRDDLHAAGRLLVTNQFQLEPEVDLTMNEFTFTYSLDDHVFEDLKCTVKTTGVKHICVKYEKKGVPTLSRLRFKNIDGGYAFSATSSSGFTVNDMLSDTVSDTGVITPRINKIRILSSPIGRLLFPNAANKSSDISVEKCVFNSAIFYTDTDINSINLNECTYNAALSRSIAKLKQVNVAGGVCNVSRMLEADWESLNIGAGFLYDAPDTAAGALFVKVGSFYTNCKSRIRNSVFNSTTDLLLAVNAGSVATQSIQAVVQFNDFAVLPTFRLGDVGTMQANFNSKQLTGIVSKNYDPPSLAAAGTAGDSVTTTVTLPGAILGDNVSVSFSQYNAAIEISPQVSAANTVTVKFKNTSASAVDMPSGTLKAKII